jgi:hypothetical protein
MSHRYLLDTNAMGDLLNKRRGVDITGGEDDQGTRVACAKKAAAARWGKATG